MNARRLTPVLILVMVVILSGLVMAFTVRSNTVSFNQEVKQEVAKHNVSQSSFPLPPSPSASNDQNAPSSPQGTATSNASGPSIPLPQVNSGKAPSTNSSKSNGNSSSDNESSTVPSQNTTEDNPSISTAPANPLNETQPTNLSQNNETALNQTVQLALEG